MGQLSMKTKFNSNIDCHVLESRQDKMLSNYIKYDILCDTNFMCLAQY